MFFSPHYQNIIFFLNSKKLSDCVFTFLPTRGHQCERRRHRLWGWVYRMESVMHPFNVGLDIKSTHPRHLHFLVSLVFEHMYAFWFIVREPQASDSSLCKSWFSHSEMPAQFLINDVTFYSEGKDGHYIDSPPYCQDYEQLLVSLLHCKVILVNINHHSYALLKF